MNISIGSYAIIFSTRVFNLQTVCHCFYSLSGSDIWGWTDSEDGHEYAIVGLSTGTSFVRVTDAMHPEVLGFMLSAVNISDYWRDMKVVNNAAYIVSEAEPHGLQVNKARTG